jgi:hypothetical protein
MVFLQNNEEVYQNKVAVSTTVIAFFLGNSLMFLFGAVGAAFYQQADISEVLLRQTITWSKRGVTADLKIPALKVSGPRLCSPGLPVFLRPDTSRVSLR